jgi:hypothetical protein
MGLFFIHPPQEYLKKSTQGSTLRSIEVTSKAGSCFDTGAEDCWPVAGLNKDAARSAITPIREIPMCDFLRLPAEQVAAAADICMDFPATRLLHFRDNSEGPFVTWPINGKVAPVQGENRIDLFPASQINESGIGKLGTDAFISLH